MARWEYITAIAIDKGVIQLIEPDGRINFYSQLGIKNLGAPRINKLIQEGKLHPKVLKLPDIPKNYSISFEDEEIMGKAERTFKDK